ncbi:metal-sensitive transcriptional regulator [Marinisporobacter balticus]|uniref:DNA-binding FrmR family transcriptional regulator n=1 Tax=Marinisporobacter balticus TaxID=2018667 RepID=A0A4R2KZP8_9FIRM|nr:metal-sensitive transcriptional regulator [Marinisporobacter balticus]TCO78702.1 DNA-binding FrmR family transcriptional regulator [Marinisporobacter balticus]
MDEQELCCSGEMTDKRHVDRPEKVNNALIKRLNRIEGQVRGIKGMIQKGVYCDDVLIQIAAVQSAMKGVSRLLLESHMHTCIIDRIKSDDEQVIDEFLKTIDRIIK